jgi:hypothetical protein
MLIETTINIQAVTLRRFNSAAAKLDIPRRCIISWLLRRLVDDSEGFHVSWSRLRYQGRDEKKDWEESHLYLTPVEYELFLDLKKVYKMSGSYLVAFAIDRYLNELYRLHGIIADNYRITNYGISRRVVNKVICWVQYWGLPPQLVQKSHHHP